MMAIEIKLGDLEFNITDDELYTMILYELALTEPMSIESQLAEDSQVLETI